MNAYSSALWIKKECIMNINTLNSEPLTSKTGKLAIALYPNTLTGGETGKRTTYYARVINRSRLCQEDIVDDIVSNGSTMSKEEIALVWKQLNSAITCRLAEGISVDTGLGTLRPAVSGSFESVSSGFEKGRHHITVQYCPGRDLRQLMSSLTPVIAQGNKTLPEITSVVDKSLGSGAGDMLRAGGFFSIRGKNILVRESEVENSYDTRADLYFDNLDDASKSVHLAPSQIFHNTQSLLEGIIPTLESGRYRVRVSSYSCGSRYRKALQEDIFDKVFVVS